MGINTAGDKPKFDLITASRSKKYRIITAVVLILGLLLLGGGFLLRSFVTEAVAPNDLQISELSGLRKEQGRDVCDISTDQTFIIRTGTVMSRALADPITFTIYDGAEQFLEVWDLNKQVINEAHFPGMFYLHVRTNCPEYIKDEFGNDVRPSGKILITCGSYAKEITVTYYKA